MKYIIALLLTLLSLSCQKSNIEVTNNEIIQDNNPAEEPTLRYINEEEWNKFFARLPSNDFQNKNYDFYFKNRYLSDTFFDAAKNNDFHERKGTSIKREIQESVFKTTGGLVILFKNQKYYLFSKNKVDKINGLPVWQLKNVFCFETSITNTGFFEATDTPNSYPIFNKEHNIYGVFDWDSPLIAPDTFIPAEKVIIVDPETLEIAVIDNEDRSYVVFIDAAFLE